MALEFFLVRFDPRVIKWNGLFSLQLDLLLKFLCESTVMQRRDA